jgi:hypothetical protein
MVGIAIRFGNIVGDQEEMLPHLGETGLAILPVKKIEKDGHDRTSLFAWNCLLRLLRAPCEMDHSAPRRITAADTRP